MTVATEVNTVTVLSVVANVPVPLTWPLLDETHVQVFYGSDGDDEAILGTDYTVQLMFPDYDTATVTPLAALVTKAGVYPVTIARTLPLLQSFSVPTNTRLPERAIEQAFDKLVMIAQQTARIVRSAIAAPAADGAIDMGLPSAAARANKVLTFDGAGKPVVLGGAQELINVTAAAAAVAAQVAIAQAAATASVNAKVAAENALDNFDDRFLGSKTSAPTLDNDGNALVAGALYYNSVVGVIYVWMGAVWAVLGATPADGAVTTPKLATGAVTTSKLADGSVTAAKLAPGVGGGGLGSNRLINPDGRVWQRENSGAAAITDALYAFDRWYGLTQSAGITASQIADAENGTPAMMRLSQANATPQRFGIAQAIESVNCKDMRGKAVALSARVRMSVTTILRYAVLEWVSTPDSLTKDVVNDWTNGTISVGNFFAGTNLVMAAAGSIALTANTLTDVSLSATLSAACSNAIVVFWTDSTQAQNVTLDIGRAKLEQGAAATAYEPRNYASELAICQRYFEAISAASNGGTGYGVAQAASTSRALITFAWKAMKRAAPTLTLSATADWAFYNAAISAFVVWSSISASLNEWGGHLDVTTATAGLAGAGTAAVMAPNASTAAARVFVNAEI